MPATVTVMKDSGAPNNITSVAGAGLRLALLLNAVACQVANLGVDIHSISKGISLFSTSLKQLGQSLQAEHSVHTTECLDTTQRIGDQARAVFEEVEDMLDKVQKAEAEPNLQDVSVQQRFKSCFKKQRVTYLLAHLESLKLSLVVILQILHLGRLQEVRSVLNTLTDELIVQERADAQNMLIVRYWSTRRLDRLWDLAQQEANEEQRLAVQFAADPPQSSGLTTVPKSLTCMKLPVIPLGVESSLNSMEESPSDMLRLTEEVLDALLKRWIRPGAGQRVRSIPRVYASSESDDDLSDDAFERDSAQGYYIEGVTTDWRRPHSQEARMQAAQFRKLYSDKQAHVHSDSDGSEDSMVRKQRRSNRKSSRKKHRAFAGSDDDDLPEQGQMNATKDEMFSTSQQKEPTPRPYSYSTSKAVPGCDADNYWRHEGVATNIQAQPQPQSRPVPVPSIQTQFPTQSRPIPVPQANLNGVTQDRLATSQSARSISSSHNGMHSNPSSYKAPATNGLPIAGSNYSQQSYYFQQQPQPPPPPPQQQHRHYVPSNPSPTFIRAQSDNVLPSPQTYQPQLQQQQSQQQYLAPPSPSMQQSQQQQSQTQHHRQRPPRHNRRPNSTTSTSRSHSPAAYNRHKDFKRTAMRGILGVSAIGGFMDALEAFSIL